MEPIYIIKMVLGFHRYKQINLGLHMVNLVELIIRVGLMK